MWYLILALIAVAGLIFGYSSLTSCSGNVNQNNHPQVPPDSIKPLYSKDEVLILLEDLAQTKVKDNLNPGAMCYSPKPITQRAEYTCPLCGEKTLYTYSEAEVVEDEIPACRRLASRFDKSTLFIDETQFCSKCRKDSVDEPKICLVTKLEGQNEVKTCGIHSIDLVLLTNFFEGKTIYKTFNDGEVSLKESIPRIKELLGIKE